MANTITTIDLFTAECPSCGPEHVLDHTGQGEPEDKAWCENCGWEGKVSDLLDG